MSTSCIPYIQFMNLRAIDKFINEQRDNIFIQSALNNNICGSYVYNFDASMIQPFATQ